jgi:hypothetical protein
MQTSSLKEYESIRLEMRDVKDCITKYVGFTFGGSGVAVVGLVAVYQLATGAEGTSFRIAIGCMALSALLPLILLVLVYKFNSHNRFAGYCKLLALETVPTRSLPPDLFLWEYCMDELRRCESNGKRWQTVCDDARLGPYAPALLAPFGPGGTMAPNQPYGLKGWVSLGRALTGTTRDTGSWSFPTHVIALFGWITLGYVLAAAVTSATVAWFIMVPEGGVGLARHHGVVLIVAWLLVVAWHGVWWHKFGGRLYSLLHGPTTVDAYYTRFMPIRARYFRSQGWRPLYWNLSEEEKESVEGPSASRT